MFVTSQRTPQRQAFGRDIHEAEISSLMHRDYTGLFRVARDIGAGEIKKRDGAQIRLEEAIFAQHCDYKHKPDAKYYTRGAQDTDSFVQITQRLLDETRPPEKSIILTKEDTQKFFAGFPKAVAQCAYNLGCGAYDPKQALLVIKNFNARNVLSLQQSAKVFREFEQGLQAAFDAEHPLKTLMGKVFKR